MVERGGVAQDQGTLAEIVEHQGGQDQAQPGDADRLAAEMAHVGIERLGAGDRQHDRTQRHEGLPAGDIEQAQGPARVHGREHRRVQDDLHGAQDGQGGEPDQHDRAEQGADAGGAAALQ